MRRETNNYTYKELNLLADCAHNCWQYANITDAEELELLRFLDKIQYLIGESEGATNAKTYTLDKN